MKQIISVINQKGGVGKTTTSVNLAAGLARDGHSTLLVDFDPQGNASSGFGIPPEGSLTSYDVILEPANLDNAVRETNINKLYLLPANGALAAAEVETASIQGREALLKNALAGANYEFVLIDCPPSVGMLTLNALVAATSLIIPVQAEYYALEGLGQLLNIVQRIRETVNPNLELMGMLLTMYDKRTTLADQVSSELHSHFGDKMFKTVIPRNVRLAEAPSFGKTIFEHDKWSKGARAYKQLSKEVESRVGS
ncbi:MAG TPA: ParA family protein [Candidatus Saccharimonadales bacterium]|jgi:chromosome partitioning protein|nr:ParA family protein [Candidatus Saccharimonadales bacterium]